MLHLNREFSASSGEWDAKLRDVMYPHNFPEEEARAFLRNMGAETLKAKLLEQLTGIDSEFEGGTVEIFFYGIGIAAYKDGQITLKL